jgi:hypothetical protein
MTSHTSHDVTHVLISFTEPFSLGNYICMLVGNGKWHSRYLCSGKQNNRKCRYLRTSTHHICIEVTLNAMRHHTCITAYVTFVLIMYLIHSLVHCTYIRITVWPEIVGTEMFQKFPYINNFYCNHFILKIT